MVLSSPYADLSESKHQLNFLTDYCAEVKHVDLAVVYGLRPDMNVYDWNDLGSEQLTEII